MVKRNNRRIKENEHRGEIISCFGDNRNDPGQDYL